MALRLCGNPVTAFKVAGGASLFGALASAGWFFTVIRFEAFNPYNDAFIYLVHAQWLQTHPFREAIRISEYHPALTQVAVYQIQGFRMGASFLFGWVQGAFGVDWSYLVYPAVMLLPMVAGALALAGTAFFVVHRGRLVCLLGGAALITTFNRFSFGAFNGFLPQTYGVVLGFGSLGLIGMYMARLQRGETIRPRGLLPGALLLAATLFCYPEFAPFLAIAAAVCVAGEALLVCRARASAILQFALLLCLFTIALVNLELSRIVQSVSIEAKAVVGGPVLWTPVQFLAHASGLLSGAWEDGVWVFFSSVLTQVLLLLFLGSSSALLIRYRKKLRLEGLAPALGLIAACVLAFLYFRYVRISPWSQGIGQSFSQFKLSNWVSIFVIFTLVCGVASAKYGPRWMQYVALGWLLIWQADKDLSNYHGPTSGLDRSEMKPASTVRRSTPTGRSGKLLSHSPATSRFTCPRGWRI